MEFNSIYGVIKIDRDYPSSIAYIKSIGEDPVYPFVNTNMFGLGEYVRPYYYDAMLITFGTTYKGFGLNRIDWNLFVLKIENILRNVDFETAKFHIDSYMGDFVFYWVNKKKKDNQWCQEYRSDKFKLIESEDFFFGFGDRPLFTPYPDSRYKKEFDEVDVDGFCYPVKFDDDAYQKVRSFTQKIKHLNIGSKANFAEITNERVDDRIFEILYYLQLKRVWDISGRHPEGGIITIYKHVDLPLKLSTGLL